ncbi:TetR/AcrR family transcriptional regulator [Nocardia sp. NPDC058480]|uniref:TetR/AcrR family transcriptional regulator n=1 Tax=unclassified Nocardia TaxID=2637762 RepID=UPI0036462488
MCSAAAYSAAIGRPKGNDPGKSRRILDAAVTEFLNEGYDRTSVDLIAERAGVAKQTVYNHFGDKTSLFLAAVEAERGRTATEFENSAAALVPVAPGADTRSALLAIGRRALAVLLDERASALRRLVISEVARYPGLQPACSAGEPAQLVRFIADELRRRTDRGELDVPDPATGARQFVALLVQQGLHESMYGTIALTDARIDSLCAETVELFLRAYRI